MTTRFIESARDPFLWLEEVESEEALAWVHECNARAEAELQDAGFAPLERELREILDSPDRIPGVLRRGAHLYNFWTDAEHPQGIWRRTTLDSYRTESPEWEVLLDLDELSAAEGVTWVWHGATVLRPEDDDAGEPGLWRRALVSLSRGGSDADVTREFDLVTREFVPQEQGGFCKPEGKGGLSWIDAETVYAFTDQFSPEPGEPAVTTSGYPRFALRWRRGTPLDQAQPVVSVEEDQMVAVAGYDSTPGFARHTAVRMLGFYDSETYLIDYGQEPPESAGQDAAAENAAESTAPRLRRVEVPTDVRVAFHRDLILLMPRTEFTLSGVAYAGGSLVVGDAEAFMAGDHSSLRTLFSPDPSTSLQGVTVTRHLILLTVMADVVDHLEAHWRQGDDAARWRSRLVFGGITGSLSVSAVDAREDDAVWITADDFLTPTSRHLGDLSPLLTEPQPEDREQEDGPETAELLKQAPERFDASGLAAVQRFARSADGTRVPYFLIGPESVSADGPSEPLPTVLYGYGGFEVSQTPGYLSLAGKAWLESGGVFAVANIRGGGEYGPGWHQAALRENRHRAYEDFAAVARDLVETGVTVREKLACRGGSNGGLLTGNMLTQHPDLFGAVVVQVPLLDMRRYAQLLAGASWRAEYGDPETEDWEFLQSFSPYHLLERDADYPSVLLTTSTRDDRVHPGHARKMTAALEELGADVRYWENTEGGHGGAANPAQQARMNALIHRYLWQQLGG